MKVENLFEIFCVFYLLVSLLTLFNKMFETPMRWITNSVNRLRQPIINYLLELITLLFLCVCFFDICVFVLDSRVLFTRGLKIQKNISFCDTNKLEIANHPKPDGNIIDFPRF